MLLLESAVREVIAGKKDMSCLDALIEEMDRDRETYAAAVEKAAHFFCTDDDTEIDDNPIVAPDEYGTWVSAWVWVANE